MTKTTNPFIVTGKIPNQFFCDRETETAQLIRFLNNRENVVLMSQRRMGKTKLVEHSFDNENKEYALMTIDILHTSSFREFIQLLGATVFDSLAKRSTRFSNIWRSPIATALLSLTSSNRLQNIQRRMWKRCCVHIYNILIMPILSLPVVSDG